MKLQRHCVLCNTPNDVEVDAAAHAAWRGGVLIQIAFPGLTPGQREEIQTGTHPGCWDALFADDCHE